MNPYTQTLVKQIKDPQLIEFAVHWDLLEELVIRIYKAKTATPEDTVEHRQARAWLLKEYPHWQAALSPYWPMALAAGRPMDKDPFALLLSVSQAGGFIDNRQALTTLPAARQALNQFLLDQIQGESS